MTLPRQHGYDQNFNVDPAETSEVAATLKVDYNKQADSGKMVTF